MRRVAALALVLGGCTPTGENDEMQLDVLEATPSVATLVHVENPERLPWPGCEQHYPPPFGEQYQPFVWETGFSEGSDHACRYGCVSRSAARTSATPGIVVGILDDGGVRIATSAWEVRVQAEGILAQHVQWTSWCGEHVAAAIHDGRNLRLVAIETVSGEIVERFEQPIEPDFAMQMHCWDSRTAVHARSTTGAWTTTLPSMGVPLQRVPGDVWAEIVAKPYGHEPTMRNREERTTTTRRFHRKGGELFAFDRADQPLWHRTTTDAWVGCLQGGQLMGLVGCSRCPAEIDGLTVIGEHAMLEHHGLRSSTDVFDANGKPVVHLQYD